MFRRPLQHFRFIHGGSARRHAPPVLGGSNFARGLPSFQPAWARVITQRTSLAKGACPTGNQSRVEHYRRLCTITDEIDGATEPTEPNSTQLRMLFLSSALPFVGFGFLDNFLMILFGEFIDSTLCVMFNFSTMLAAAIGNTISDVAGIFSGGAVEHLAEKAGVSEPPLDREQKQMLVTRTWQYAGQCIGIVVGCVLGCCPLLWMDPKEAERLRHEKEREAVFESVIIKVGEILAAEAVALLFDKQEDQLVSTHVSPNLPHFKWPKNAGFIGHVVQTGRFVNVADTRDEPLYDPALHDNLAGSGIRVQSILCMPIFQAGSVHGVIIVLNKSGGPFTRKDEDILSAICSHISVACSESKNTFAEVIEHCERSMKTTCSQDWSTSGAAQRMRMLYIPALEGIRTAVRAEAATLMLLDSKNQELVSEVIDGPLLPHRTRIGEGIAGEAVKTGKTLNVGQADQNRWFRPERHLHSHGSDIDVRSELVVPLMDTSKKCLGALRCINKKDAAIFSKDDMAYVMEAAHHIGMMLEGPETGLKRVLALSRRRMQQKEAMSKGSLHQCAVLCRLEKAQNLPSVSSTKTIDPYVTFSIHRGNPLENQQPDLPNRIWRSRNKDRRESIRRFAKSNTILQDPNPTWGETIALGMPPKFQGTPRGELFVHILLWDYSTLSQDELIAQAAIPLTEMPLKEGRAKPIELLPLPGQGLEGLKDSGQARLWVSFSTCAE